MTHVFLYSTFVKKKKAMKKKELSFWAAAMSIAAIITACEIVDNTPNDDPDDNQESPIPERVLDLYSTFLEYEQSYDWRKDPMGGMVNTRIHLFKNKDEICTVNVPAEEHETVDCNILRICNGKLYTVHSVGTSTVIRANGIELLRLPMSGYVSDLIVQEEDIHIIMERPEIQGWRYMKNGQTLLEKPNSSLMGPMYQDKGEICFAFVEKSKGADGIERPYCHLVANGVPSRHSTSGNVQEIYDIRRLNGVLNVVQKEFGTNGIVWTSGDNSCVLNVPGNHGLRDIHFVKAGNLLFVHAQAKLEKQQSELQWYDHYWNGNELVAVAGDMDSVLGISEGPGGFCYVTGSAYLGQGLTIFHPTQKLKLQGSLNLISPYAITSSATDFYLGLNDASRNYKPVMVHNNEQHDVNMNGYFISLALQ